jgi:hypothetical protein
MDTVFQLLIIGWLLVGPVFYGIYGIVKKSFPVSKSKSVTGSAAVKYGTFSLLVGLACIAVLVYLNLRARNLVY